MQVISNTDKKMNYILELFGANNLITLYSDNAMQKPIFRIEQDSEGRVTQDFDGLVRLLRENKEEKGVFGFMKKLNTKPSPYFLKFYGDSENLVSLHKVIDGQAMAYIREHEGEIICDFNGLIQDVNRLRETKNRPVIFILNQQITYF